MRFDRFVFAFHRGTLHILIQNCLQFAAFVRQAAFPEYIPGQCHKPFGRTRNINLQSQLSVVDIIPLLIKGKSGYRQQNTQPCTRRRFLHIAAIQCMNDLCCPRLEPGFLPARIKKRIIAEQLPKCCIHVALLGFCKAVIQIERTDRTGHAKAQAVIYGSAVRFGFQRFQCFLI